MSKSSKYKITRRFLFNRYQDEAYLYDTKEQNYLVHQGVSTDVLHTLARRACSIKELEFIMNAVLERQPLSRESLVAFVEKQKRDGLVAEWSCELDDISPDALVSEIRKMRSTSYFFAPLAANLFINGRCNQKCEFCFLDFDLMRAEHAVQRNTEEWLEITKNLIDCGVHTINIGGMEPMLSFKLTAEILTYAKSRGCILGMITNGSIPMQEEHLRVLADLQPQVGISLQSASPETHDELAVLPKAFQRCVENVRNLVKYGINVGIQSVATRENVDDLEDFVKWLEDIGVRAFNMQSIFGGPWCSQNDFFSIGLHANEYLRVQKKLHRISEETAVEISMDAFPHERDPCEMKLKGQRLRALSTCSAGKTAMQVSPNGDAYPCPFTVALEEHRLGNLLESSALEVWHKTEAFGDFRRMDRMDYESEACQGCPEFSACRGGCLITAKAVQGSYLAGDPRCSKVEENLLRINTPII